VRFGLDLGPFIVHRDSAADRRAKRKERDHTVWDEPSQHPFQAIFIASVVVALLINFVLFVWPFVLAGLALWFFVYVVREVRRERRRR
jgi:Flp pilus assembly protein TadB